MLPLNRAAAARAVVLAVVGVTVFILLLDGWLFRAHLPQRYVDFYTSPLSPRTFVVCAMAMIEEVKYRLLLMTALVVLARLARVPMMPALLWGIVIVAQFANVHPWVLDDPLYATLRYWVVGCTWGWLYWRHGWVAALLGHGVNHLLLDPLLLVALK